MALVLEALTVCLLEALDSWPEPLIELKYEVATEALAELQQNWE
jgi:hypothetical protein